MDISVVIVNYNVKHFLKQCISSVYCALGDLQGEIIVVDNASTDGSKEYIASTFPKVNWIQNEENVGFGKANNQAIKICKGKYTLLLNPDTVLRSDTLKKCITFFEKHKDAGAIGIKMIDGSGKFLPESKRSFPTPEVAFYKLFGLSYLFPKNKKFGQYHLTFQDKDENHIVDVLSGAFLMTKTDLLKTVGGFDEDFFMYGEDIDLSYRLQKVGYNNYYTSDSTIIHYKGESTKKGSINYVKHFYQAMVIFARKHYTSRKRKLFVAIMNLAIAFRGILALFGSFVRSIGLLIFDFVLSFVIIFGFKEFWLYFKTDIGEYLQSIYFINFPIYIASGLMAMFFSGAYDRPYKFSKIVRGGIYAIILIAIIYAFLPAEFRFSRAMIIFSGIGLIMALTINRMFIQYFRHGSFSFYRSKKRAFLILGGIDSLIIKDELLSESQFYTFLGLVTNQNVSHDDKVGGLHQLGDMIKQIQPTDIIVDNTYISNTKFVDLVSNYGRSNVRFHSSIDNGSTIISSHDSNLSGEISKIGKQYKIDLPGEKRKKRLFDFVSALVLLIISPLLIWFQNNKMKYIKDCFIVLLGNKTWIGYANGENLGLPKIKEGILTTHGLQQDKYHTKSIEKQLNHRYAMYYSIYEDLDILLQNINRL